MGISRKVLCISATHGVQEFDIETKYGESVNAIVGEFTVFTSGLQVWAPVQCDNCLTVRLRDLGETYADEDLSEEHRERDMGPERNRWYGGAYTCEECSTDYNVEVRFNHYALGGAFLPEKTKGCKIIPLLGLGEMAKSVQEARLKSDEEDNE
ncbi:MAG: hypothetical protein JRN11_05935 [Nitrososphaerota archaeon]|nr:hypothetical protein [Nitrososphaerota archaeon]MDG7013189.1 hypothetical protein [Nitrososphaerota archaeon]MDG7026270.1 hypothetical protein [Nitrososphaerota archaeon]